MSDTLDQNISALFDGELDELGLARVLSESEQQQLRKKIHRYSIAQSILHAEPIDASVLNLDISQDVARALEGVEHNENINTTHSNAQHANASAVTTVQAWFKPVVGFAVAASVAFLMVFSVDYWKHLQTSDVQAIAASQQSVQDEEFEIDRSALVQVSASNVSWTEQQLNDPYRVAVAADQELRRREEALLKAQQENALMQQKLREYLINHSRQTSALNPVNDVVPITRASYAVME